MKKVLLVATVQSHICQFHKPLINFLKENGCEVHVAARDNLAEKNGLTLTEPDKVINIPFRRSPYSPKNIKAYKALKKLIVSEGYDIVHCNTPVGGILTRMACKKIRKNKPYVIYEAHGFHFFKGGPAKNWVLWYPIEKHFSRYTDLLITINQMDYELAKKKFKAKRTEKVPGVGVNLAQFNCKEGGLTKKDLGLQDDDRIILSVGELNKNKNHQVVIKALAELKNPKVHYFICGNGKEKDNLVNLSRKLGVENQLHLMGYRRDVPDFYKLADVFAFPSLREGLAISPVEAMNFGVPIVTSDRRGINDFSENGVTGFMYDPYDYKGMAEGINRILSDNNLKEKIGENNKEICKKYSLEEAVKAISEIYRSVFNEIGD